MLWWGTGVTGAEGFPSLATAEPLSNATVIEPVVQKQGTGVSGEVEKFLTPNICSLCNDYVYRPVQVQGVPV